MAEPIARQSNREYECTGRFWEGRYRCQPLLDESAVLACLAYADLNPIRAKIAATPESSRFTSVFERIMAEREAVSGKSSADASAEETHEGKSVESQSSGMRVKNASEKDGQECSSSGRGEWLSPLLLAGEVAEEFSSTPTRRASNQGCLPLPLAEYLQLLDWMGRQLRRDKREVGSRGVSRNGQQNARDGVPSYVAPILQRLKITDDGWLKLVKDFSRMFRRAAGIPATLANEATRRGRRWLKGIGPSRATFA